MPGLPGNAGLDGQKVRAPNVCAKQTQQWFCFINYDYIWLIRFSLKGEVGEPGPRGFKGSTGPPVS